MTDLILSIINEGLKFLNAHEANALKFRIVKLRSEWNEELSKGHARDDARLDMLTRELLDIGQLFLASIKSTTPADKS